MCLRRWVRAGGYETINGAVHNYSGAMPIWHGGREFLGLSFFFFFFFFSPSPSGSFLLFYFFPFFRGGGGILGKGKRKKLGSVCFTDKNWHALQRLTRGDVKTEQNDVYTRDKRGGW